VITLKLACFIIYYECTESRYVGVQLVCTIGWVYVGDSYVFTNQCLLKLI